MLSGTDILELLKVAAEADIHDSLWWNDKLEMFVNVSDIFGLACADAEPIETHWDIASLARAFADLGSVTSAVDAEIYAAALYAVRRRRRLPHPAVLRGLPDNVRALMAASMLEPVAGSAEGGP